LPIAFVCYARCMGSKKEFAKNCVVRQAVDSSKEPKGARFSIVCVRYGPAI
jgi:hypothetical protein